MLQIGVTGGIGSGKSMVCKIFQLLQIPVYFADDRAKNIMVENQVLIAQIKKQFGNQSYFENGTLNRNYISNIVFKDAEKLKILNSIVHPAVFEDYKKWIVLHQKYPYILKESALLFETKTQTLVDKIIVVTATNTIKIERVIARDNITKEAVLDRMNKQMPDEDKIKMANCIIENNSNNLNLVAKVLDIHKKIMNTI